MLLQLTLFVIYVIMIALCAWLARRHRDKPIHQALLMPIASFAIYALVRRVMLWTVGGEVVLADKYLVVFWLYELGWLLWAVRMTVRARQGKAFVAPDGQRWRVYPGHAGGRSVRQALPVRREG